MIAVKSLVAGAMLSATLWSASDANAGGRCHRTYRVPVYYQPMVHEHHHGHGPHGPGGPGGPHRDDDDDHGGGPGGGQGLGGPGGRGGIGQGGPQGIGGPNGGGRNGGTQNGQGQNGQGQNGNNQNGNGQGQVSQNGQNQNGNNVQAVQVPSGSQVTLTGSYGNDGQVYLNINNVKLPLAVDQWTETGITLTLPSVQLTQAQSATIDVVAKNGKTDSIAITLNPQARLIVNNQPKPAGGGTATVSTTNVAGAQ